jgi:putative hemolysin
MKRVVAIALAVVLSISGCGGNDDNDNEQPGVANPASVYCEEQGGTVDIRTDESGSQIGYCVFSDGSEVEEWAFFRGEAEPEVPND